jgi:DNA (cytosine-5)-methyltransferase 1
VATKGNGDAFAYTERHTALSTGGGQAGQGYPCALIKCAGGSARGSSGDSIGSFMGGMGAKARTIGYSETATPTIRSVMSGGNTIPDVVYG